MSRFYTQKKIAQIFGTNISKTSFFKAEEDNLIPRGQRFKSGAINLRGWDQSALPVIGEQWGPLKNFPRPLAISVFTTKGGVLKTTISLNLARMAALHNIRTCVVGLDMQGDITRAMGHNADIENSGDLKEIIDRINQTKGLPDIFNKSARLSEVILPTELPTLHYIPETPELAAFNEFLGHVNRREYWLKEKIIDPLKQHFDLIIMDCSPNWNRLITNSLVSCDVLLGPLECKINNFRNFRVFEHFLKEFKKEMILNFKTIFIPTRFSAGRKLSLEIKNWYINNIPGCLKNGLRESTTSEEATALRLSIPEHTPTKSVAVEIRDLLIEINEKISGNQQDLHLKNNIALNDRLNRSKENPRSPMPANSN